MHTSRVTNKHSRRSTTVQTHSGTNAHGMTYPIARQSRPASAPRRQGQPRPARPARAQHPARAARRAALCTLRCVPRPALRCPGGVPGPAVRCVGVRCVFVQCAHRRARRRGRRRRRCGGGGGGRRLEALSLSPVLPPVVPSRLALWCSPLPRIPSPGLAWRFAWPGLALCLARSGALALWRSATAAGSGAGRGARERFAPGAGAGEIGRAHV